MKALPYLLPLFIIFVQACGGSPSTAEEEEACTDGTPVDQLNCRVGFSDWRLVSVTSDTPRPLDSLGESTRDWLEFQPECYRNSFLELPGFVGDADGNVVNFYAIGAPEAPCRGELPSTIITDPDFNSAEVLTAEDAALFFYGIDYGQPGAVTDIWYDIQVERAESITFRVDKTLDDVDYRVSVRLEAIN